MISKIESIIFKKSILINVCCYSRLLMTSRALYALHAYHSQICLLKYGSVGYGDRRLVLRLITLTSRYESNETVSMNAAHLLLNIFN